MKKIAFKPNFLIFQTFIDHFGEDMYKYMIVIFTVRSEKVISVDDIVKRSPPALKEVLSLAGNRYIAFDNRYNLYFKKS